MRFVVIHKDKIFNIPPLISAMYILRDLGHEVKLITCGVSEELDADFKNKNIDYVVLPYATANNPLTKAYEYLKFRKGVQKLITRETNSILWIEGAYTIRSLGSIIKGYRYILQISELHEKSKPQLRAIGKVIHEAQVVFMPEYNRSVIYQVWFDLKNRPVVLPNKPYFVPGRETLDYLKEKYADIIKKIDGKKIILYQGYIADDRDISSVIKAVKRLGCEYVMLIVGKDLGVLKDYRKIDQDLVYVNFLPAPDYLLFTSLAYIGIMTYTPTHLNNIFCAPNKIFEYGAFGLPMIGNDIPGMKVLESEKAGVVVDFGDEEGVMNAIKIISEDYKSYSANSKALYDKTDNKKVIEKAIDSLKSFSKK